MPREASSRTTSPPTPHVRPRTPAGWTIAAPVRGDSGRVTVFHASLPSGTPTGTLGVLGTPGTGLQPAQRAP